jgi:multidrug resistance efflux pump
MTSVLERRAQPGLLPDVVSTPRTKYSWSRLAKLGGAFAVLGLGAYALWSDQASIATDNAVVSAYAVSVRTPIDGVITAEARHVGDRVSRGDLVGEVINVRVDDQHLVDLREHLKRVRANLDAATAEQQTLGALRDDLKRRSKAYIEASSARLAGSVAEAERLLAAATAKREQAERTLARKSSLSKTGFSSPADLESAQSDFDIASRQVSAQQGHLDSLRAQAQAVNQGVVSEPGSNDVTYSMQRADEITIRLSELDRELALAQADILETTARLQGEEERLSRLQKASLLAPTSGIIWKLEASTGERLGAGDMVAQIVDCGRTFIIAAVPQNRFPDVAVGSVAEYRLAGDSVKRHGVVVSVTGDATGGDHNLAAIPFDQNGQGVTVRIAVDPTAGECLVGRTARVLLPPSRRGVFKDIIGRFF